MVNGLENSVLEVPDSPVEPDEIPMEPEDSEGHQPQNWQTVPFSEIENTSLPPVLEPRKNPRKPKVKGGKRSDSESPLRDPSVKKKRKR